MLFLSLPFYIAVTILLILYYAAPVRARWMVLLAGSLGIYGWFFGGDILLLGACVLVSYFTGLFLKGIRERNGAKTGERLCLTLGILAAVFPLSLHFFHKDSVFFLQAAGIAYYTLQAVGYMADVYRGEIAAETNPAKHTLFLSFFPQIVQGPIPRYGQLGPQLFGENLFDEGKFSRGLQWILWGFFLKIMIADRAGIVVNTVFDNWEIYTGCYVLVAGILYSIQLYTDFMACVFIARGIALLFGIELTDNFAHPYFSDSVREFWGRWHISLSSWLRDYIYIPLGGNRKGRLRRWLNLAIVFAVSGIWHGSGYKYIAWGGLHAGYQIVGEITAGSRGKLYRLIHMEEGELAARVIRKTTTFFWVMLAWIIFRADSLRIGIKMLGSLFTVYNPWIFFDDSLFALGLDIKECMLLFLAILLLFAVSCRQSRSKEGLGEWLSRQHVILRWGVYLLAVTILVVFGVYGYGFDAGEFIYGGF